MVQRQGDQLGKLGKGVCMLAKACSSGAADPVGWLGCVWPTTEGRGGGAECVWAMETNNVCLVQTCCGLAEVLSRDGACRSHLTCCLLGAHPVRSSTRTA